MLLAEKCFRTRALNQRKESKQLSLINTGLCYIQLYVAVIGLIGHKGTCNVMRTPFQWFRLRKSRLIPQWRIAVAVFANLAPFAIVSVENNMLSEAGSLLECRFHPLLWDKYLPGQTRNALLKAITYASLDLAIPFK